MKMFLLFRQRRVKQTHVPQTSLIVRVKISPQYLCF